MEYDYISAIIEYEDGSLDEEGVIELFQYLVNTGIIFSLQGSYQRQAQGLLDAGLIVPKSNVKENVK